MPAQGRIHYEREGEVAVLRLDDGKANAVSHELIAELGPALERAEKEAKAVVIAGRPGRFSAGFDLATMTAGPAEARALVEAGCGLLLRLYLHPQPVVVACTGHALAAGALLLLGCDVRIGADIDAKIGLNEVAIRMVLPDWAFTIATERLSKRHLQRAVATARLTTPRDAVDVGFLDEVVPASDLLDRAIAVAAELASTLDASAYRRTIAELRGGVLDTMAAQVAADRAAGSSPV
jgi:enoyl-CoA hydratase/carnithine racemase